MRSMMPAWVEIFSSNNSEAVRDTIPLLKVVGLRSELKGREIEAGKEKQFLFKEPFNNNNERCSTDTRCIKCHR
jgi:hypothetical protein